MKKESVELSLKRKIEVLKESLIFMEKQYIDYQNGSCGIISDNIHKHILSQNMYLFADRIRDYFPEYSLGMAITLSGIYNFEKPKNLAYWWDVSDPRPRISFMQALLTELESQLK